jgi:hypothetical protein
MLDAIIKFLLRKTDLKKTVKRQVELNEYRINNLLNFARSTHFKQDAENAKDTICELRVINKNLKRII